MFFELLSKSIKMIKDLDITRLQIGDILSFSGKDSFMTRLITTLTESEVYHSALYMGNGIIIQAGVPMVNIYQLNSDNRFQGQKMYINRFNHGALPKQPIIEVARSYCDIMTPYAYGTLILVGFIYLYKRFCPFVNEGTIKLLEYLVSRIIDLRYNQPHIGGLPKTCSQFVFDSYENTGNDYHLQKKPNLRSEFGFIDQIIEYVKKNTEFFIELPSATNINLPIQNLPSQIDEIDEQLAQELLAEIPSELSEANINNRISKRLVLAVLRFGEAIYLLEELSISNNSILRQSRQLATDQNIPRGLALLKIKEQYFVTPEDLFNNFNNLIKIDCISLD